jgi:hypothetical protein
MTANDKQQLIQQLRDAYNDWEEALAGLTDEQITRPLKPSDLPIKDVIAHLWAWQQISVARIEAALEGREYHRLGWPEELGADLDEDVDKTNAWIYETNKNRPWPSVYEDWRSQFLRYLDLSQQVPEEDMLGQGKYKWMGSWALADSMQGSYEHHTEHLEQLHEWLGQNGDAVD